MLWFSIFRSKRITAIEAGVIILLIASIPMRAMLSGNRGGLFANLIPIVMAFCMSGRKVKIHHTIIFGTLFTLAAIVGMAYGSTYRAIKGSQSRITVDEFFNTVGKTTDALMKQDTGKSLDFALNSLYERLETLSSLAVVVSNHEKLKNYEKQYGLESNIWTYTWTAFIPRILWPNKPLISDGNSYSDLYFDYGENSFAVTCIGDLLRNFGPIGVPLGMALLGFILRLIYASLIENHPISVWRSATYFMLLFSISYEGFYGVILPSLLRVGFIMVLCLIFVKFIIGRSRSVAV
jgi:hypothetical protein